MFFETMTYNTGMCVVINCNRTFDITIANRLFCRLRLESCMSKMRWRIERKAARLFVEMRNNAGICIVIGCNRILHMFVRAAGR